MNKRVEVSNKDFSDMHFKNSKIKQYDISYLSLRNSLIEGWTFEQCLGYELGMKEAVLRETQFLQTKIENCYMRHASFDRCKFTGSKITSSNLEKAQFEQCDLSYVQFENCILNVENLLKNSPEKINLRLFFYKQLYKNELQMGNSEQYDKLLYLIRETEKEINKKIWTNTDTYFKASSSERMTCFVSWIMCWISKILFGYGLKFQIILLSYTGLMFLFSIMYHILFKIPWIESFEYSIQNSLLSNISITNFDTNLNIRIISYSQNFIGIIYVAVLTSAFYRRVAR